MTEFWNVCRLWIIWAFISFSSNGTYNCSSWRWSLSSIQCYQHNNCSFWSTILGENFFQSSVSSLTDPMECPEGGTQQCVKFACATYAFHREQPLRPLLLLFFLFCFVVFLFRCIHFMATIQCMSIFTRTCKVEAIHAQMNNIFKALPNFN